jgi:hypothetical protein
MCLLALTGSPDAAVWATLDWPPWRYLHSPSDALRVRLFSETQALNWNPLECRSTSSKMRCLKAFGERIAARDPDRQTAEIHI